MQWHIFKKFWQFWEKNLYYIFKLSFIFKYCFFYEFLIFAHMDSQKKPKQDSMVMSLLFQFREDQSYGQ